MAPDRLPPLCVIGVGTHLTAHWETWRPYTLAYPVMLALAGVGSTGSDDVGWNVVMSCVGLSAGWLGAHYLGDLLDRDLDAIAKPHRPIPSGRLTPTAAAVSAMVCFGLLVGIGIAIDWRTIPVSAAIIVGIAGYSARFKARGFSGNAVRGSLGAFGLLYGAMAVSSWATWTLLVSAFVFCCHDISSNLVGTLRDAEGDRAGGYDTVAAVRGTTFTVALARSLYAAAIVAAAAVPWLLAKNNGAYVVSLVVSAVLGWYAFRLLSRSDRPQRIQALRAHAILNIERLVLTAGFATYAVDLGAVVPVLLVSILSAVVLHRLMREKHEFGAKHPARAKTSTGPG
ncbi:UbiA family prenyltransferase [Nocardia sp. NBC_00508]|uniref:UbiA family prenyltransferase n=1 Tax=Nocardia sp. NBC_00508 TaxID=2975992 RepID=UPI002E80E0B7|nr:UbiA family prenyltransferase [Nocardia sp. NBC_00508]WUD66564.1 UbiA family prenyltransferase [Nocardia sp. NBC_00508]